MPGGQSAPVSITSHAITNDQGRQAGGARVLWSGQTPECASAVLLTLVFGLHLPSLSCLPATAIVLQPPASALRRPPYLLNEAT